MGISEHRCIFLEEGLEVIDAGFELPLPAGVEVLLNVHNVFLILQLMVFDFTQPL